jgi:hypothetical protein
MKRLLLTIWAIGSLLAAQAQTDYFIRKPYVQLANDTSFHVCWRSAYNDSTYVVYGTAPDQLTQRAITAGSRRNHYQQIVGLQPNTQYYYGVVTVNGDTFKSNTHYCYTHPVKGTEQPIRFWSMGDMGSYNTRQQRVVDAFLNYNNGKRVDAWLNLGDMIYDWGPYNSGADTTFTWNFSTVYEPLIRNTVTWPTPGNHDYESVNMSNITGPYFDLFLTPTQAQAGGVASNTKEYYSFDIGNVHFISLNSENLNTRLQGWPAQRTWLQQDVNAITNSSKWVVAYWHASPYSQGSHNSDNFWENMVTARQQFIPLLDQAGVDLVLGGHSHNYERSFLVKGLRNSNSAGSYRQATHQVQGGRGPYTKPKTNPRSAGCVYVVAGSGGKLDIGDGALAHPVNVVGMDTASGGLVVDISGDTLTARFLTESGFIFDEFQIIKTDAVTAVEPLGGKLAFTAYPNPTEGQLTLGFTLQETSPVRISLMDMTGREIAVLVNEKAVAPGAQTLFLPDALSNLSAGAYQVRIEAAGAISYQQVLRQ